MNGIGNGYLTIFDKRAAIAFSRDDGRRSKA
jgi:hypothetical protein